METPTDQSFVLKYWKRINELSFSDYTNFFLGWKFLLCLISALVLFFYHEEIEGFIADYILGYTSSFSTSGFFKTIYCLSIVAIIVYSIKLCRVRYRLPFIIHYAIATTTIGYLLFKIIATQWKLIEVIPKTAVFYSDIILLVATCWVILLVVRWDNKNVLLDAKGGFVLDKPTGKDLLNRKKHANNLAERIKSTFNTTASFAVGIVDAWGGGKTSFLGMIENNFDDKEHIVVNFNPWKNQGEKSIIIDFFKLLEKELSVYDYKIGHTLQKYVSAMLNLSKTPWSKTFQQLISLRLAPPVQEQYDKVDKRIASLGRKVVIFIDDLDRLDKGELVEVLRLIRNTANFSNTIFIVAYDRGYVLSAIDKFNSYGSEVFLEKIFQYEYYLPRFSKVLLKQQLLERIKGLTKMSVPEAELLGLTLEKKYDVVEEHLNNLRDINRLANAFSFYYPLVKNNLEFEDYFYLEVLKLKYPSVHKLVHDKREMFFKEQFVKVASIAPSPLTGSLEDEESAVMVLRKSNEAIPPKYLENLPSQNDDAEDEPLPQSTVLEDYLVNNAAKYQINSSKINDIVRLIHVIFPNTPAATEKGSNTVMLPTLFDSYFHLHFPENKLIEAEIISTEPTAASSDVSNHQGNENEAVEINNDESKRRAAQSDSVNNYARSVIDQADAKTYATVAEFFENLGSIDTLKYYRENKELFIKTIMAKEREPYLINFLAEIKHYESSEQLKEIIEILFQLARKTHHVGVTAAALNELGNKVNAKDIVQRKLMTSTELEEFTLSLFEASKYPYLFESNTVYRILKDNLEESYYRSKVDAPTTSALGVSISKWKKLQTSFLEKYLEHTTKIDSIAFELWDRSHPHHADFVDINYEATDLIKKVVKNDPEAFAPFAIAEGDGEYQLNGSAGFIYQVTENSFDDAGMTPKEIVEKANELKEQNVRELIRWIETKTATPVLKEFKEFCNAYIEQGLGYTKFEFEHIQPRAIRSKIKTTIELTFLDQVLFARMKIDEQFFNSLKPLECFMKLPPHNDNKLILLDRTDRELSAIMNTLMKNLKDQILLVERSQMNVNYKSWEEAKPNERGLWIEAEPLVEISYFKRERNF